MSGNHYVPGIGKDGSLLSCILRAAVFSDTDPHSPVLSGVSLEPCGDLVVCQRADAAGLRQVVWRDGSAWRTARRLPLHVRAGLSAYETRRAENHTANNLPTRQERALGALRRALPRIVGAS